LTLSQHFKNFFSKYGIEEKNPLGEPFNPNEHHAIAFINAPEASKVNLVA